MIMIILINTSVLTNVSTKRIVRKVRRLTTRHMVNTRTEFRTINLLIFPIHTFLVNFPKLKRSKFMHTVLRVPQGNDIIASFQCSPMTFQRLFTRFSAHVLLLTHSNLRHTTKILKVLV